jgi:hypothetical protein
MVELLGVLLVGQHVRLSRKPGPGDHFGRQVTSDRVGRGVEMVVRVKDTVGKALLNLGDIDTAPTELGALSHAVFLLLTRFYVVIGRYS